MKEETEIFNIGYKQGYKKAVEDVLTLVEKQDYFISAVDMIPTINQLIGECDENS